MISTASIRKQFEGLTNQYGQQLASLSEKARERLSRLRADQGRNRGWLTAVVLAFGLGLTIGILTAPKTGRETRENLSQRAKNVTSILGRRDAESSEETEIGVIG